MKKYLIITIILSIFLTLFCWSENTVPNGLMLGSRVEIERIRNGGGGEIGYVIYNSQNIRNMVIFQVSGYGTNIGGMADISMKLTIGGVSENRYHSYGFLRGGVCFPGDPELSWDLSGGAGFELFASNTQSFFIEMGGGTNWRNSIMEEEEGYGGYAFIAPGLRYYF